MNRCDMCRKKVGLVPFSCKCDLKSLCSNCRYPDKHNCLFDFKKDGKDLLIKNNPIIINSKIEKI